MAISVGDAVLKLGVDTKDLDRGMQGLGNRIKKHHKAIGLAMTAAGGAILAAGALSVKTYAKMGDEVQKMALRTGFSTEALSELRHAAEISGASLSTLEKGVKRMSGTILDAQDGLETYIRAFQHIGIEVEELRGLNPEEQFLKIAEAIAEVEDPTKRAAIAQDIFGRAGTELLPLFAAGKKGLAELREEAHKLGIVFDQEAANKAAEFNDAMTRMKESVSGVQMAIAENLIPILLPLIDKIKNIVSGISDWMKEHPGLSKAIVLTTGAIGGLLFVLGPLLIVLPQIVTALNIMRGVMLSRLIPALITLITTLWAKVAALFAVMVAMGPVGWAMAAAGMALLTTGLIMLHKEQNKQLQELSGATEDLTTVTDSATEAQRKSTEALEEDITWRDKATGSVISQAQAFSELREQMEASYATARQGIAPPVMEPFVSAEHRTRWVAEMNKWQERARISAAEGHTQQAAFESQQAAAMGSRLAGMEHGGIAMRPMVATLAEKKPEAVLPLDKLERMIGSGGYRTMNFTLELNRRVLSRVVAVEMVDDIRLDTGMRI